MNTRKHINIAPAAVRGVCYVSAALLTTLISSLKTDHHVTLIGGLSIALSGINALRAFLDTSASRASSQPPMEQR